MRILLLVQDLYRTVGGGETVYRKLIEANPDIDFFYFTVAEQAERKAPPNAKALRLSTGVDIVVDAGSSHTRGELANLRTANAYCRSVSGQAFDVVEFPDYLTFGSYLRSCLFHHGVSYGALALAMHGNVSTSIALGWAPDLAVAAEDRELEYRQFVDVDARYAISRRYISEWTSKFSAEVHYVDPLSIVGPIDVLDWQQSADRPDLYCIGRLERRKGNDLFTDLVRWLDPKAYAAAFHVGPEEYLPNGRSSASMLADIATARGVFVRDLPGQGSDGLRQIYQRNSLIVLPARYDPFNLVALEALLSGCPVAVSSDAGVCDYLDETLPEVPYLKLDMRNLYGNVPALETLISDYTGYRRRLLAVLRSTRRPLADFDMRSFYERAVERGAARRLVQHGDEVIAYDERSPTLASRAYELARRSLPNPAKQAAKRILRTPKQTATRVLERADVYSDAKLFWHVARGLRTRKQLNQAAALPERDPGEIERKLRAFELLGESPLARCNVWKHLARLERLRGNELVAASYELRIIRLLGNDRLGQLAQVIETLERNRLGSVAAACRALYGNSSRPEAVYEYLKDAYRNGLTAAAKGWQRVEDRRHTSGARVSIIVSLYDAADKLEFFLSSLAAQRMVRRGEAEIVLVDSGSPADEYVVANDYFARQPLNAVYARSTGRETIQSAWNRGIALARAPYLVFLGVDETLYPEALDELARELDRDSTVDWVMANSLVTEVDERGLLRQDVMTYDRANAAKDYAYLETCYLSWVGGMYRKSVHERFGFYDETFRAAGDTEFKNRVLPHIRVKFIPRLLGLFLNYPEARTTASPLAELEDTRAWYIHRSLGGVRYAFENRKDEEVRRLLLAALGYRKSYCRHTSSDIDYAMNLLGFMKSRGAISARDDLEADLCRLLRSMRSLDWEEGASSASPAARLAAAWFAAARLQRKHARFEVGGASPTYKVLNDNRYEQHFWLWSAA